MIEKAPVPVRTVAESIAESIIQSNPEAREIDECFRAKRAAYLADCLANRDWSGYLFGQERCFMLTAFLAVKHRMTDREYWENLRLIWNDSEYAFVNRGRWLELFLSNRGKLALMNEEEKDRLAKLPDPAILYRGVRDVAHVRSLSWTDDENEASWWACRFGSATRGCCVVRASLPKWRLLACFLDRNENEVVIDYRRIVFALHLTAGEEIERRADGVRARRKERETRRLAEAISSAKIGEATKMAI